MPAQESECIVQRMYREAKVSEEKGVGSTVQQDAVPQERMCSIACLYTKPTIRPRCMPRWEAYLPSRIRKLPREIDPSVPQDDTEVYSWPSFTGPWHSNIRTFAKQAKFPTACVFLWCLWGARNCQRISGSIWLDVWSNYGVEVRWNEAGSGQYIRLVASRCKTFNFPISKSRQLSRPRMFVPSWIGGTSYGVQSTPC